MSTLKVTAEQLTVHPHPNADALELAQVGLFRAVVAKGAYRPGDWAVYIPESALVPEGLVEELGLTGKLAGSRRNRVKAIRLRGELSQGIVCRPHAQGWHGVRVGGGPHVLARSKGRVSPTARVARVTTVSAGRRRPFS